MKSLLMSSVAVAACGCLALGASIEACGGSTSGGAVPDGGVIDDAGDGAVASEASVDAGPDAKPRFDEPLTVFGAYVAKSIFLGETNRSGAAVKDAWKDYGENLDGIVSVKATTNGECKLQAGADSAKREDGNLGIDNSFGRTVLGFLLGIVPTPSKTTNEGIAKGGGTMMLNLLPASGGAPARFGFLAAAATTTVPLFDGKDLRSATASSVGTSPDDPLVVSTTPSMSGRLVASGIASGTFYFELPLQGAGWRLPIRHARVTMNVSPDGLTATTGTLSGIAPTEELVAELTKAAGRISTQLCGGSTLDTIKQTIRQASDILVDGTQDPSKDCDGISIGIGFEAVKVSASGVAADLPPGPDPCN